MTKVIFLLDDERNFADGRDAIIARTTDEAIAAVANLNEIHELWLDFILDYGEDVMPFIWHLVNRHNAGNPVKIHRVIFHSSAWQARGLIETVGAKAGFPEIEWPPAPATKTHIN